MAQRLPAASRALPRSCSQQARRSGSSICPFRIRCDAADVNFDGTVNVLDLIQLLLAFGTTCP